MPAPSTIRRWLGAAMLALPVLFGPTRSDAQQLRPSPNRHPAMIEFPSTGGAPRAPRAFHGPRRVSLAATTESEPNDSFITATLLTLGDTVRGIVSPGGVDVDWYALDLTAGTTVQIDLDAAKVGSSLKAWLSLFYADGVNGLVQPRYNDDSQPWAPFYWITIPATGRYYVMIEDPWWESSGPNDFYTLKITPFEPPPLGPGDPTILFAEGVGNPYGMVAAGNGDIFVADAGLHSILRVDPAGRVFTYASGITDPWDVAIDGWGDVLVASPSRGVIRITPSGVLSIFASNFTAVSVTIDHVGDVWVGGSTAAGLQIRRYDPTGTLLSTIPFLEEEGGGLVASGIAVSPTGDVYTHNAYNGIYRVTGGAPTRVLTTPINCLWDLAFDADGYLYVTSCYGKVLLYDPALQPVATPFARTIGGPVVFGRDASGGMTSRLFVASGALNILPPFVGGIVELNPAAMRAAGLRVGVDLLRMATTTLRPGFVAVPYADTLRLLNAPVPVIWSTTSGALPAGIQLNAATGVLSGRPERGGSFTFSARGTSGAQFGMGTYTLSVSTINVPATLAAKAFLGESGAVSPEVEHLLDQLGNGNGRLDVADFRAYLQSIGKLAAPAGRVTP